MEAIYRDEPGAFDSLELNVKCRDLLRLCPFCLPRTVAERGLKLYERLPDIWSQGEDGG
jgi:hypothetical protein